MSWYRGKYVVKRKNLWQMMDGSQNKKDCHFRVRNKDKADGTVVKFVSYSCALKN